ncbi:MAG: 50S ribosomal protein L11 methyltransferase [Desulforhopalus sp.]
MEREKMTDNRWLKITIETDPQLVDAISDFLVGVLDAGVETGAADEPHYGMVSCYIRQPNLDHQEEKGVLARISSFLDELAEIFKVARPQMSTALIVEEDWGKSWKAHFKPFTIVPGLVISPSWEEYRPVAGEALLTMDPGMAFGTGHHATTTLCLKFVRETVKNSYGCRLLDVGTGTGILGMAGLLFGAETARGIDNDPDAVSAAQKNVRMNGLEKRMRVGLEPLSSVEERYQVVVANIVHDVLVAMVDDLTRVTADDGTLILSGILAGPQVENIVDVFSVQGFHLIGQERQLEWAALQFKKRVKRSGKTDRYTSSAGVKE